jgi:hypothetical protein
MAAKRGSVNAGGSIRMCDSSASAKASGTVDASAVDAMCRLSSDGAMAPASSGGRERDIEKHPRNNAFARTAISYDVHVQPV